MASGTLTRSRTNKVLAGVCGGIADYAGWDAGVVRAIFGIVSLLTAVGLGVAIYIILWIVLPEEGSSTTGLDSIVGSFRRKSPDEPDLR